jgi:hypothetical protein
MKEDAMTAFNVVRFRVKPGQEQRFLDAHKNLNGGFEGMRHANLVKTGDRTYCFVGEWDNYDALVRGRPEMIATLDGFRDCLEDLGNGLGVTDPISGDVAVSLR